MQEGSDKRYFLQQLSLAFFYGLLVDVLVVCEHDIGINGKVKQVLPA